MLNLIGRAYAQVTPPLISPLPVGNITIQQFIIRSLTWLFYAAGVITVIYLIWGGLTYITAGGDPEKATKGKTAVVNAIIGIVVILLALGIITWVTNAVQGPA